MNYPLISEYIEAIKTAEDSFKELCYLRPVLDDDGQPVMTSGNFAVVFKMKDERDGKLYAVKCFTKEQAGRTESYKLIADELEFVSSNYLTPIKYLEKELFVDTDQSNEQEFPVLLMDWVEGKTLEVYIKENIDNQYALEMLAYQFSKLAGWLITQQFAHGDLKLDNIIMKEDGQLVLVDYDGIFVPAMKGQKARELGSPDFRHPMRTEDTFDEHIDDFSIATIALSLKAIALEPSLYTDFGGNDRLIFSERDFQDMAKSHCLSTLQSLLIDKELTILYGIFMIAWARNDISDISYRLFNIEKKQKEDIQKIVSSYLKGKKLIEEKEYEQAYRLFFSLAKKGKTTGETTEGLGNLCGSVLGANGIGYMYAYGLFVQKDLKQAVCWFKQAADRGFTMSIFNLGICYERELGVKKDMKEANRLYDLAKEQGFGPAKDLRSWHVIDPDGIFPGLEETENIKRLRKITSKFYL